MGQYSDRQVVAESSAFASPPIRFNELHIHGLLDSSSFGNSSTVLVDLRSSRAIHAVGIFVIPYSDPGQRGRPWTQIPGSPATNINDEPSDLSKTVS